MFDKNTIPHTHIGNKIIRLDTLEDQDGIKYTQEQIEKLQEKEKQKGVK